MENGSNRVAGIYVRVPEGLTGREFRDILGSVARDLGITMNDLVRDALLAHDDIQAKVNTKLKTKSKAGNK